MKRSYLCVWFCLLLATVAAAQTSPAPPDPHAPVLDRLHDITTIPLVKWSAHDVDLPHGEDPALDTSGWQAVALKENWNPASRWLRTTIEVPAQWKGYKIDGARLRLDFHVESSATLGYTVFSNGNMVFRGDEDNLVPITLSQSAVPGQRFVIAIRILDTAGVGCCGKPATRLQRAEIFIDPPATRPDPAVTRLELMSSQLLVAAYPDGKAERQQQLDAAVKAIDLGALDRGDQPAFDNSLKAAQVKLDLLRPYIQQFSVNAVGNSHIDMAWLWPETETVEVVRNTFGTALELMREYPDFKFTASAAQAYTWIEEKYPAMFKEIQQRVKEGRWEVIGGMWVEPDLNMPDGESLVRQILYGKNYFKDKFGVDVKIGWNPDSFGYNWQLPQIYKRSGIDYFVTQKLMWAHEFTTFPYRFFYWQSPDGSRILTYFPSDYANQIDPLKMARDSANYGPMMWKYNGGANAAPADGLKMMYLYGVGDHGGGPTRNDLDTALRWQKPDVVYPRINFSTATDYFADLKKNESELKIPTWDGELYFQYHRGVQTTQSETKRGNRKSEVLLLDAEKLASINTLFGATYPKPGFDTSWQKVLFNQFHDILPGSGIGINYVDAARKYAQVATFSNDTSQEVLTNLASRVRSDGVSVLVFNPLSWPRTEVVEFDAQFPEPMSAILATGTNGRAMHSEVVSKDPQTGKVRMRVLVRDVPAIGYEVINLNQTTVIKESSAPPALIANDTSIENEFLRVTVDAKTGCITSLIDKRTNTEALAPAVPGEGAPASLPDGKPCGNLLQAFVDKPKDWDAWNVDADFIQHHTDLLQAEEVKLMEKSYLRDTIRVRHKWQNSEFVQDITMYPGVPRVDVHMQADWHEKHILLKVAFPLNVRSDKATFEIPYGTVERPTTRNTPAEKAQFEVPALRWGDISGPSINAGTHNMADQAAGDQAAGAQAAGAQTAADQTAGAPSSSPSSGDRVGLLHGFSLLNDSKYGYDAKDNVLRLSLLRAPEYPDPNADQGHHEFTYSLYPHAGTWREAMTVRQGYNLNYPLLATTTGQHPGTLPPQKSFFGTQEDNVVITAVKQAADGSGLIVRFYEWAGKKGDIHVTLPQAATSATETNLMEQPDHPLTLTSEGTAVVVPTNPYEIKTVKVQFGKM